MSMKSFDKFCEHLILDEPGAEKAIYDERQNQLRMRYTLEALIVFASASFLNTIIMECGWQWCESYVVPMAFFGAISLLYWVIRNAAKETLFGVNGTKAVVSSGCLEMSVGILYAVTTMPQSFGDFKEFFIVDGMVGENFLLSVSMLIYFSAGLAIVIAAHKFKKAQRAAEEN